MATYTSQRRRKRVDPATGATLGEQDDRRAQALSRLTRGQRVAQAASSLGADPGKPGRAQMAGGGSGGTGSVNASRVSSNVVSNVRAARIKDPDAEARRARRKQEYGIEDLRTAAAEQIEKAKKDPLAFGGKRTVTDARLASANQSGRMKPPIGGRPVSLGTLTVNTDSGLKRRKRGSKRMRARSGVSD